MISDKTKRILSPREIIGFILSVILSIVFLYFAFTGIDFGGLAESLKSASVFWIIIFVLLILSGHFLRAVRWKILLDPIKKDISLNNLFATLMIGYGFNNIIPRLGEIVRPAALGNLEGISRTSVFGTIVIERIIDMIFMGLAVIGSAYLVSGNIYLHLPWLKATIIIGVILISMAVVFLIVIIKFREQFYGTIHKLLSKFSLKNAERFGSLFNKITDGFGTLTGFRNYFLVTLLSIIIIFVYAFTSYIGLFLFEIPSSTHINFYTGWVISGISSIGIMIPTPGGIGSYHTITKATLVSLYGFTPEIAMTYAILTHGISYVVHMLVALGYILSLRNKISFFTNNSLETQNEKS